MTTSTTISPPYEKSSALNDKDEYTTLPNPTTTTTPSTQKITITLLPDPTPAHAPALRAWTSLFGAKTSRPHPDQLAFKETYSHPNGRLLLASTPENAVAGLIAFRKYDGRFAHLRGLAFLGDGGEGGGGEGGGEEQGDETTRRQPQENKVVEVVRLFVSPSLRNQGIATLLIRALVELARADGVGYMYLHTHPFLPGAERLWEKEGWGVLEREEGGPWWTIHMGRGLLV